MYHKYEVTGEMKIQFKMLVGADSKSQLRMKIEDCGVLGEGGELMEDTQQIIKSSIKIERAD